MQKAKYLNKILANLRLIVYRKQVMKQLILGLEFDYLHNNEEKRMDKNAMRMREIPEKGTMKIPLHAPMHPTQLVMQLLALA